MYFEFYNGALAVDSTFTWTKETRSSRSGLTFPGEKKKTKGKFESERKRTTETIPPFMASVWFCYLLHGMLESAKKAPNLCNVSDMEYYDMHLYFGRPRISYLSSRSGLARCPAAASCCRRRVRGASAEADTI